MSQRANLGVLAEAVVSTVMHSPWPRVKYSFGINIRSDITNSFLYRFEIRETVIMSRTAHVARNLWWLFLECHLCIANSDRLAIDNIHRNVRIVSNFSLLPNL